MHYKEVIFMSFMNTHSELVFRLKNVDAKGIRHSTSYGSKHKSIRM